MPTTIPQSTTATKLQSVLEALLQTPLPVRVRAWDGSTAGPADGPSSSSAVRCAD
jgi:cyclopropane-fatty-acyl-phospholipid synthase